MSAAARAEARRKAILSRGQDRLAKLTTSARGEDAKAYIHDDPPLAALPKRPTVEEFMGEESALPTPPPLSRTTSSSRKPSETASTTSSQTAAPTSAASAFQAAGLGSNAPDPSIWSEEQQRQLLQALMGASSAAQQNASSQQQQQRRIPSSSASAASSDTLGGSDPLMALMAQLNQDGSGMKPPMDFSAFGAGMGQPPAPPKPRTMVQKLMPLIHIVAALMLLGYFVVWKEPLAYELSGHGVAGKNDWWGRWADLSWKSPVDGWGVQPVPFFYAFTTLAIVLHSWRIFSGLVSSSLHVHLIRYSPRIQDPVETPFLLSLALNYLPHPYPSYIRNGLKYLQIATVFLDDLSAVIVALGLLVYIASWVAR
ncbi:hypothetical protein K474DRAFT_725983 [Panus rudis PR-1116 ss-1]|nr:hypothetical protein K474DRAFT_725983 [Panus rudis PR-1116 ss-1]